MAFKHTKSMLTAAWQQHNQRCGPLSPCTNQHGNPLRLPPYFTVGWQYSLIYMSALKQKLDAHARDATGGRGEPSSSFFATDDREFERSQPYLICRTAAQACSKLHSVVDS